MKILIVVVLCCAFYAATADGIPYFTGSSYGGYGCEGIHKKRVRYGCGRSFSYDMGKGYSYKVGYYKRKCRKPGKTNRYDASYKCERKPGYGPSSGYNNDYRKCKAVECDFQTYNAYSKCHGHVRLSYVFRDYAYECPSRYGADCGHKHFGYDVKHSGYSNEHQPGYGHPSAGYGYHDSSHGPGYVKDYKPVYKCHCKTHPCHKKVFACYKHKGYAYKDYLYVEKPCSCGCAQKH